MAKIKIVFHPGLGRVKNFSPIPTPPEPFDLSVDAEGEELRAALSHFFKSHHPLAPLLCDEDGELSAIAKRRWPIFLVLHTNDSSELDGLILSQDNFSGANILDLPLKDGWQIFVDWWPARN